MKDKEVKQLQTDYDSLLSVSERFRDELVKQVSHLLGEAQIYLAVPIEARIKSWPSLREKLTRRALVLSKITDLRDLIGVRIVLLFRRDINKVCELLERTFKIASKEDTATRLTDNQFGYSSLHYVIALPEEWLTVPSFRGLSDLMAEVQVRTAAQHIWAASSHVLQYKQEASVPTPLKRTIYRISALLETVDLEFERVLDEKNAYIAALSPSKVEPLNVDSLERVLDEVWPKRNKDSVDPEDFSSLLQELFRFDIKDTDSLHKIVEKQRKKALVHDVSIAKTQADHDFALSQYDRERALAGYWFTHVGLTRQVLHEEFGERWKQYQNEKLLGSRNSKPKTETVQ